ncbi:hypothetical protein PEX2_089980 [Penicillium expansum]|uniref:Uncharacterized protein n=1 Tax=Penicillium expansum TaxID=27334 RepID=A0A0A2JJD6_PENEN|nr:hypothetical protein PEX2_089980 [Penicillium expansum]KGO54936.1 hypothetical protein PEX2_089980 [Penicillium expansum]
MVGKMYAALWGLFGITSAFTTGAKVRRDEIPKFPHDSQTISSCSWWHDNDGSVPPFYNIELHQFPHWSLLLRRSVRSDFQYSRFRSSSFERSGLQRGSIQCSSVQFGGVQYSSIQRGSI